jgi:hypothetical protein
MVAVLHQLPTAIAYRPWQQRQCDATATSPLPVPMSSKREAHEHAN